MLAALDLPITLDGTDSLTLRRAVPTDVDQIVALLTDDAINTSRGDAAQGTDLEVYKQAFDSVMHDHSNDIVVGVDALEKVVGTLQLTRIPGMVRGGATRLLVEAVFVARAARSRGVGTSLMRWVVNAAAPSLGTDLVQLTSDATREGAHRFYQRLGFTASHIGFKLSLAERNA